ncbi:MAG: nuclear transport factor 2 family protein [Mycobacterium sp.]
METSTLEHLLSSYYQVLNTRNLDGITEVLAEDAEFDDDFVPGAVFHSAREVRDVFSAMWQAFPDLTFTILSGPFFDDVTGQSMVHGRITGTLTQALPDFGLIKVGGEIDQEYMALYSAAGTQLSYVRVCLDRSVTAGQLG